MEFIYIILYAAGIRNRYEIPEWLWEAFDHYSECA